MELKTKLIKLFKNTCSSYDVSRTLNEIRIDHNYDVKTEIWKLLPKQIEVGELKPMVNKSANLSTWWTGFRFNNQPPIGIGWVDKTYQVKYGHFIPILGYLLINNYRRRKKYKLFCDGKVTEEPQKYEYYYDTLEKYFRLTLSIPVIVHGTLFSEITTDEYGELKKLYRDSVMEYDNFMLNERLK